jgi:hypothetical protein
LFSALFAQEAAVRAYFPKNLPNSVNDQNAYFHSNPVLPPQSNLISQPIVQNTQNNTPINQINGNNNIIVNSPTNNQVTIINRIYVIGIEGIKNTEGLKIVEIVKTINDNNNEDLSDFLINHGVQIKEADMIRHYQKYDREGTK